MKAEVVYSVPEHCGLLAEAMDEAGKELIRAGWGVGAQQGLERAYWSCPLHLRWTILLDGKVVGMFGCAESADEPGVGYPWLTTAPGIEKVKLRFIRQSRGYIDRMFERCGLLVSHAHKDNKPLLSWLRWNGFECTEIEGGFLRCVCRR